MHAFLNTALTAAQSTGNMIMKNFGRLDRVKIDKKGPKDFVTSVDHKAEAIIIETLQEAYPDHSFLGEEGGQMGSSDHQWIIDPLDGTTNFIHGYPHFCISIALKIKGRVEHALIYDPILDEAFTASRGQGAYLNNQRLRVSTTHNLDESLLTTGTPLRADHEKFDAYFDMIKQLTPQVVSMRRSGSSALDLAYVAAGRTDGYFKIGLKLWDMAAGVLLIREAGGLISDIDGSENYLDSGNVLTANPKLFKLLLKQIKPHF